MERHISEVVDLCVYLHVEGSHLLAAYVYDFRETQDHHLIHHLMPDIRKDIPDGFMQQFFACIIGQCGNQSAQNTITNPTLNSFIQTEYLNIHPNQLPLYNTSHLSDTIHCVR